MGTTGIAMRWRLNNTPLNPLSRGDLKVSLRELILNYERGLDEVLMMNDADSGDGNFNF